jgi:hypothetical protein
MAQFAGLKLLDGLSQIRTKQGLRRELRAASLWQNGQLAGISKNCHFGAAFRFAK